MKRCPKCDEVKDIEDFARNRHRSDGRNGWCSDCSNTQRRFRYKDSEFRENTLMLNQLWRVRNRDYDLARKQVQQAIKKGKTPDWGRLFRFHPYLKVNAHRNSAA